MLVSERLENNKDFEKAWNILTWEIFKSPGNKAKFYKSRPGYLG